MITAATPATTARRPGRQRHACFGGDGNDTLDGGDGNDQLVGGNGQ